MLVTKPIDPSQLAQELTAAAIPNTGIGTTGGDLNTNAQKDVRMYNNASELVDMSPAAQTVVNSHVSQTAARITQNTTDHGTLATFDNHLATYIALANPTAAQNTSMVQDMAKFFRYLIRRLQDQGQI